MKTDMNQNPSKTAIAPEIKPKPGRELTSSQHVVIKPGAAGVIMSSETLHLPPNKGAIIGIRKKFGRLGINVGATLIKPGYTGRVEIQVHNRDKYETIEVNQGDAVLNVMVVDADVVTNIFMDDIDE